MSASRRQALFGGLLAWLTGCRAPAQARGPADNYLGTYMLFHYGEAGKTLDAANAMCALGGLAGAFAQIQARSMLAAGAMPKPRRSLVEVQTDAGRKFYFGDAINACVIEGDEKYPSLWNYIAAAANDPDIDKKIDLGEIAAYVASTIGTSEFGQPRLDPLFRLTEAPLDAIRVHGGHLRLKLRELKVADGDLVSLFGIVGQTLVGFAAGESGIDPNVILPREDGVRLFMEAAIPMSKIDLSQFGL